MDPARLYDSLSRFEYWKAKCTLHSSLENLGIHKQLAAPPRESAADLPAGGIGGLNAWLTGKIGTACRPTKVLDIGCGFGATLLHLRRLLPAEVHGLTISSYQKKVALHLAAKWGTSDSIRFFLGSFEDPLPDRYNVIVSIETLVHASDLGRALSNLSNSLVRGGHVFMVEDMGVSNGIVRAPTEWEKQLGALWGLQRVFRIDDFKKAFEGARLRVRESIDLTGQVQVRPASSTAKAMRRLKWARRAAPTTFLDNLLAAYLGGLIVEQFYAEGTFNYRYYHLSSEE